MQKDRQELEKAKMVYDNAVKCEFEIQQDLIKYAIGRGGSNITKAKEIEDIMDVKIIEDSRHGSRPRVLITANTQDAIDEARDLLDIVRRKLDVPGSIMGQLIGRRGQKINDIKNASGVRLIQSKEIYLDTLREEIRKKKDARKDIKITPEVLEQIEKEIEEPEDDEFGLAEDYHGDKTPMVVVGTRDNVETALGLLACKVKHMYEMKHLNANNKKIQTDLEDYTGRPAYGYSSRGRRGGGRGGRERGGRGDGGGQNRNRRQNRNERKKNRNGSESGDSTTPSSSSMSTAQREGENAI